MIIGLNGLRLAAQFYAFNSHYAVTTGTFTQDTFLRKKAGFSTTYDINYKYRVEGIDYENKGFTSINPQYRDSAVVYYDISNPQNSYLDKPDTLEMLAFGIVVTLLMSYGIYTAWKRKT